MIRPVISRMFQLYTKAPQRYSECAFNGKRGTVSFGIGPDVAELSCTKGLTPEKIQQRRNALNDYIISGMKTDNVKLDSVPTFEELLKTTADEIIDSCGDDLAKINKLAGLYGLVKYAAFPKQKSTGNSNILETGDLYETFEESFSNYLMRHYVGSVDKLYQGYGECGKIMYEKYSDLGFIRQGKNKDGKLIYNTTPSFLKAKSPSDNLSHLK